MLQRVVRSTIIDAPIERVWAVLRDFNSHIRHCRFQFNDALNASMVDAFTDKSLHCAKGCNVL